MAAWIWCATCWSTRTSGVSRQAPIHSFASRRLTPRVVRRLRSKFRSILGRAHGPGPPTRRASPHTGRTEYYNDPTARRRTPSSPPAVCSSSTTARFCFSAVVIRASGPCLEAPRTSGRPRHSEGCACSRPNWTNTTSTPACASRSATTSPVHTPTSAEPSTPHTPASQRRRSPATCDPYGRRPLPRKHNTEICFAHAHRPVNHRPVHGLLCAQVKRTYHREDSYVRSLSSAVRSAPPAVVLCAASASGWRTAMRPFWPVGVAADREGGGAGAAKSKLQCPQGHRCVTKTMH